MSGISWISRPPLLDQTANPTHRACLRDDGEGAAGCQPGRSSEGASAASG